MLVGPSPEWMNSHGTCITFRWFDSVGRHGGWNTITTFKGGRCSHRTSLHSGDGGDPQRCIEPRLFRPGSGLQGFRDFAETPSRGPLPEDSNPRGIGKGPDGRPVCSDEGQAPQGVACGGSHLHPATTAAVDDTRREVAARRTNFGIQRIEILPGNVGYLQFTAFYRRNEASEAIASAMASLRHADALILDLRENGGGSTETMALLASYFYEAQGLPLFEVFPRPPAKVAKFMTEATPLPDRNERRPTYVLVSRNTWSGGEGLAFNLQDRHRAEVIGETTPGAGNQARTHRLNAQFEVTIPNGSVRSAIRHQSWEGVGVVPDVPAASSDALRVAHGRALQKLLKCTPGGIWRAVLEKQLLLLGESKN